MWIDVGSSDDLRPGQMRVVEHKRREILVCRAADGTLHALRGTCPHRGAQLRYGRLGPLVTSQGFGEYELQSDTTVIRCPWHAFEFEVASGSCVADPRYEVRTYAVREQDGQIQVEV